ncbi:hypothetical protein PHLCEN_2v643, partial [Hermanssonia centrifuga]
HGCLNGKICDIHIKRSFNADGVRVLVEHLFDVWIVKKIYWTLTLTLKNPYPSQGSKPSKGLRGLGGSKGPKVFFLLSFGWIAATLTLDPWRVSGPLQITKGVAEALEEKPQSQY